MTDVPAYKTLKLLNICKLVLSKFVFIYTHFLCLKSRFQIGKLKVPVDNIFFSKLHFPYFIFINVMSANFPQVRAQL